MQKAYHDYKKITRKYDRIIKEKELTLKEKRREFDQEVRGLEDVPDRDQISRITKMVNDMHSLEEDIMKFRGYRLRDWKRWLEDLRERR